MKTAEGWRALAGAALSPLSLVFVLPSALWVSQIAHGVSPNPRMLGAIPAALILGYVGMVIFGAPLYLLLRPLRHMKTLSVSVAATIGFFASLITPQILEAGSSSAIAISNLRTLLENPSMWFDAISLSGAAVGVVFWLIVRPGLLSSKISN